ncbi:hypothetical protein C6376_26870 [Streptomyces sp. P3]|nr:hypothetical protein C6376_26870 [Streptomyces sp. P3]
MCPACEACRVRAIGTSPSARDNAKCSTPCVASVTATVATGVQRRRASGQTAENCATVKTVTSRQGTVPSAIAWWPKAATRVPSAANSAARAQVPARPARSAPARRWSPIT